MSARHVVIASLAAGAAAGLWYVAVVDRPAHGAGDGTASVATTAPTAVESVQPAQPQAALAGDQAAFGEDPATSEADSENERIARENARKPIEEQSPEIQRRYYESLLAAAVRSRRTQRETLERLQAQRAEADPQMRAVIDERIEAKQKLLQEREQQIASYESKVPPSQ